MCGGWVATRTLRWILLTKRFQFCALAYTAFKPARTETLQSLPCDPAKAKRLARDRATRWRLGSVAHLLVRIHSTPILLTRTAWMILTIGAKAETAATMDRDQRGTSRPASWAMKISTRTALGGRIQTTATFGCRGKYPWAGLPITTVIGRGFLLGAGLGSMMHRGAMHRFTTAAGYLSRRTGAGYLGRSRSSLCMRRRWWLSLADRTSEWRFQLGEAATMRM